MTWLITPFRRIWDKILHNERQDTNHLLWNVPRQRLRRLHGERIGHGRYTWSQFSSNCSEMHRVRFFSSTCTIPCILIMLIPTFSIKNLFTKTTRNASVKRFKLCVPNVLNSNRNKWWVSLVFRPGRRWASVFVIHQHAEGNHNEAFELRWLCTKFDERRFTADYSQAFAVVGFHGREERKYLFALSRRKGRSIDRRNFSWLQFSPSEWARNKCTTNRNRTVNSCDIETSPINTMAILLVLIVIRFLSSTTFRFLHSSSRCFFVNSISYRNLNQVM